MILVGPNNAGKSTVLDAIGLGLGSAKFSKYVPSDEDFWRAADGTTADEFSINLTLTATGGGTLPAVKGGVGDPIDVHGIRSTAARDDSLQRRLVDEKGNVIMLTASTPVSKDKKESYRGHNLGGRRYARLQEIQQWMPILWHIDAKTLFLSLYEWRSGPLQQLLKAYKEDLLNSTWKTASGHDMPDALGKAHKFLREQALPTPFWKDKLSVKIQQKLREYLGQRGGFSMDPGLNPVEDWVLSEFQILISPGKQLAPVDARRLGDGWQSLLRLAAMETVAELGVDDRRAFILAEEPETYLHPHLRRRLRRSLARLQQAGYQIALTTHAPELLSFRESQQIVRLRMTSAGVVATEYVTSSASAALKQEEKLSERGNHELIFANMVVLTEGKPDAYAVRMGLEKIGIDVDADSVSIIDCGGVGNLPDYAAVCKALGIPWVAIHDLDMEASGKQKAVTAKAVAALTSLVGSGDSILDWKNDLEDAVGYRGAGGMAKVTSEWIDQTHGSKTWSAIKSESILSNYSAVIETTSKQIETALSS